MRNEQPRLIGLDWGSSSLRAFLLSEHGTVLAQKISAQGVLSIATGDFAAAYHAIVDDWRFATNRLPTIASGMIGSTEGWVRAPYRLCPAGPRELAAGVVVVMASDDVAVHVVPGVEMRGAAPDVMRGEETQLVGALALMPELARRDTTLILPGTHAKWVELRAGRIVRFATYMTGEMFALLRDHSILGRPARAAHTDGEASPEAFERGVVAAQANDTRGIAALLFRSRALVLQGALRPQESLDFLSGLLIGDELRSALESASTNLVLIGDPMLCDRYRRAFAVYGIVDVPVIANAAPAGLWHIARHLGLVGRPLSHV